MFDPENYTIASALFLRLLGFIYFVVYLPLLFQVKGLLSSKGILPIERYLNAVKENLGQRAYYVLPTLFWLNASDRCLLGVVWSAFLCSILLMLNLLSPLMLLLLYLFHLSIVSAGQAFLSFGWEMFLLEITVNAFFLSLTDTPNLMIFISLNLLLFRFHFQAGIVKLQSEDPHWRDLTALSYHYESQPLPNATAWFVHKLPKWFHQFSVACMFFVQLIASFAVFGTQEMRFAAWICFLGLQGIIWSTGNFSYLNYMTVALATVLLSNEYLSVFSGLVHQVISHPSLYLTWFLNLVGGTLIFLQLMNLQINVFSPISLFTKILSKLSYFHVINRYGIFAIMTTHRYEIVVEGSQDEKEWKEYLFRYKPSETNRRPRRIAPFQPRLDWQAWFLPFNDFEDNVWFQFFLIKLLKGEKEVLGLIRFNPFQDKPPKYIRALVYEYRYTDFKTLWKTGNWWNRTCYGYYSPVIKLRDRFD